MFPETDSSPKTIRFFMFIFNVFTSRFYLKNFSTFSIESFHFITSNLSLIKDKPLQYKLFLFHLYNFNLILIFYYINYLNLFKRTFFPIFKSNQIHTPIVQATQQRMALMCCPLSVLKKKLFFSKTLSTRTSFKMADILSKTEINNFTYFE